MHWFFPLNVILNKIKETHSGGSIVCISCVFVCLCMHIIYKKEFMFRFLALWPDVAQQASEALVEYWIYTSQKHGRSKIKIFINFDVLR